VVRIMGGDCAALAVVSLAIIWRQTTTGDAAVTEDIAVAVTDWAASP
jgi:hypothetical protein